MTQYGRWISILASAHLLVLESTASMLSSDPLMTSYQSIVQPCAFESQWFCVRVSYFSKVHTLGSVSPSTIHAFSTYSVNCKLLLHSFKRKYFFLVLQFGVTIDGADYSGFLLEKEWFRFECYLPLPSSSYVTYYFRVPNISSHYFYF